MIVCGGEDGGVRKGKCEDSKERGSEEERTFVVLQQRKLSDEGPEPQNAGNGNGKRERIQKPHDHMNGRKNGKFLERRCEHSIPAGKFNKEKEEHPSQEDSDERLFALTKEKNSLPEGKNKKTSESDGDNGREQHAEFVNAHGHTEICIEPRPLRNHEEGAQHESESAHSFRKAIEWHRPRELPHEAPDGNEITKCEEERETPISADPEEDCFQAHPEVFRMTEEIKRQEKWKCEESEEGGNVPGTVNDDPGTKCKEARAESESPRALFSGEEEKCEKPSHEWHGVVHKVSGTHVE